MAAKPKTDWLAVVCWLALFALLTFLGGIVETEYDFGAKPNQEMTHETKRR